MIHAPMRAPISAAQMATVTVLMSPLLPGPGHRQHAAAGWHSVRHPRAWVERPARWPILAALRFVGVAPIIYGLMAETVPLANLTCTHPASQIGKRQFLQR